MTGGHSDGPVAVTVAIAAGRPRSTGRSSGGGISQSSNSDSEQVHSDDDGDMISPASSTAPRAPLQTVAPEMLHVQPGQVAGQTQPMHACTLCDKSYPTKNSLARHLHNHKPVAQHRCTICGVQFRRRDILLRHSKIHVAGGSMQSAVDMGAVLGPVSGPVSVPGPVPGLVAGPAPVHMLAPAVVAGSKTGPSMAAPPRVTLQAAPPPPKQKQQSPAVAPATTAIPSVEPTAEAGVRKRRRCHTACQYCRKARSKCDGEFPCSACEHSGRECKYGQNSLRLSSRAVLRVKEGAENRQMGGARDQDDVSDLVGDRWYGKTTTGTATPVTLATTPSGQSRLAGLAHPHQHVQPQHLHAHVHAGQAGPSYPVGYVGQQTGQGRTTNRLVRPVERNNPGQENGLGPVGTGQPAFGDFAGPTSADFEGFSFDPSLYMTPIDLPDWQWMHQDLFLRAEPSLTWAQQHQADGPMFGHSTGPVGPTHLMAATPSGPTVIADGFSTGPAAGIVGVADVGSMEPEPGRLSQLHQHAPGATIGSRNSSFISNPPTDPSARPGVASTVASGVANRTGPGADSNSQSRQLVAAQTELINQIVEYSSKAAMEPASAGSTQHVAFFTDVSHRISALFWPGRPDDEEGRLVVERCVDLYFENFHPLWVIVLLPTGADPMRQLQPLLYLTILSIGAMYDDDAAGTTFGTMLHERLRDTMIANQFEFADSEPEPLWLLEALTLTQLAALYFGYRRAFSAAQHIGCMLISHARRLRLFSVQRYRFSHLQAIYRCRVAERRESLWIRLQTKVRLAFSIFRSDAYMSALLNTPPLMSPIEMEADIAMYVFNPQKIHDIDASIEFAMREVDGTMAERPAVKQLSDAVRIALDRRERLPGSLGPGEHEILLFGLQGDVWKYCHDPGTANRLSVLSKPRKTTDHGPFDDYDLGAAKVSGQVGEVAWNSSPEHSDTRYMDDLRSDSCRLATALEKWRHSFMEAAKMPNCPVPARPVLVTSLLLYHLTMLRMHAPVDSFQRLSYGLDSRDASSLLSDGAATLPASTITASCAFNTMEFLEGLYAWSERPHADTAVWHAIQIWRLIRAELARPADQRVQLNLMSFVGLHHGGVVIWAYALSHDQEDSKFFLPVSGPIAADPGPGVNSVLNKCSYVREKRRKGEGGSNVAGLGKRSRVEVEGLELAAAEMSIDRDDPRPVARVKPRTSVTSGLDRAGAADAADPTVSSDEEKSETVVLCRSEIPTLLSAFAALYEHISPAWSLKSTFAEAAWLLARRPPPTLEEEKRKNDGRMERERRLDREIFRDRARERERKAAEARAVAGRR